MAESKEAGEVTGDRASTGGNSSSNKYSRFLLKCAIVRWPYLVQPLVEKTGSGCVSSTQWKRVFSFCGKFPRPPAGCYLHVVGLAYCERTASLGQGIWSRPEVLQWFEEVALSLISDFEVADGHTRVLGGTGGSSSGRDGGVLESDGYSTNTVDWNKTLTAFYTRLAALSCPLSKYKHAKLEDFREEFQRFPADMNPIEPQLQDPVLLAGGDAGHMLVQQNLNGGNGLLADILHAGEGRRARQRRRRNGDFGDDDHGGWGRHRNRGMGILNALFGPMGRRGTAPREPNIDLRRPLLQLLVMTLFPWVVIP